PTATPRPAETTAETHDATSGENADGKEREPQKPTKATIKTTAKGKNAKKKPDNAATQTKPTRNGRTAQSQTRSQKPEESKRKHPKGRNEEKHPRFLRVVFFCERREDGAGFGGGRFDRDAIIERSESESTSCADFRTN
ncbi:MAG: hypothetical protein H0W77_13595, partial [Acidobacteria bacterium]|nr:hypothetical protein [Acidobacteriota bacterium]